MVSGSWLLVPAVGASVLVASIPKTKNHEPLTAPQREHPISETIRLPNGGLSERPGQTFTVTLAVDIPNVGKTWHLYSITQPPGGPIRTKLSVAPASTFRNAGTIKATAPMIADDPNFGIMTETYTDSAVFEIPVVASPTATGTKRLIVSMFYQTCNDRYCLPPTEDSIGVDVRLAGEPITNGAWPAASTAAPAKKLATPSDSAATVPATGLPGPPAPAVPAIEPPTALGPVPTPPVTTIPGDGSLALFLWIAATMGALSLLTPCVFPMVPITISYFSRDGMRARGDAFRDAAVYAGGIVVAFTALGLGLALLLGASGLNRFAANPWLNLAIAALFAGFAFSLFGLLDLGVPGTVLTKVDAFTRDSRLGRDGTTLLMGATFALTSFTCTAPLVGTLLVSATQGSWKWPALGLVTFSAVFALPFLILALVPEWLARLPRSGEWMVTLKGTLAFLELAAAMKFLSNADLVEGWGVFTRQVVLTIWVVLGIGLTLYLFGVRLPLRARPLAGAGGITGALVTLAVTIWLSTGLAGHRLGELEPFLPPAGANASGVANANELAWVLNDYPGALALARSENKPVLIDFTGYTCTNCRWMEANMFPRAEIRRELEQFVRVRLFTDGRDESNVRQQALEEKKFNTVALPLYAIVDPNGTTRGQFLGMTRKSDEFLAFLTGAALPAK